MPWSCAACTFVNDSDVAVVCGVCESARASVRMWTCGRCACLNDDDRGACMACGRLRDDDGWPQAVVADDASSGSSRSTDCWIVPQSTPVAAKRDHSVGSRVIIVSDSSPVVLDLRSDSEEEGVADAADSSSERVRLSVGPSPGISIVPDSPRARQVREDLPGGGSPDVDPIPNVNDAAPRLRNRKRVSDGCPDLNAILGDDDSVAWLGRLCRDGQRDIARDLHDMSPGNRPRQSNRSLVAGTDISRRTDAAGEKASKEDAALRRKAAREEEALRKKTGKQEAKLNLSRMQGKFKWSEVTAYIPRPIWAKYEEPIAKAVEQIKDADLRSFVVDETGTNVIRWTRRRITGDLDGSCVIEDGRLRFSRDSQFAEERLPFSAVLLQANEFIDKFESKQLVPLLDYCLSTPGSSVAMVVQELKRVMRLNSNRRMRQELSGQQGAPASCALTSVTQIDDLAAEILVRYEGRCRFLNFTCQEETAMFVAQATRHLVDEPYVVDPSASFSVRFKQGKSAVVGGVYTPAVKEWFNMLGRIPHLSHARAEAIMAQFPTCAALLLAYSRCPTPDSKKALLQDLVVNGRRLGLAASSAVYEYFAV
ncbi:RanBP2-type domain-containing protein [Plasmodiophora brassicae]|uniref:RanBP2-type domain-containing protein n=1 Tax=Plasmodiophora brassicae TaxID=37360 RepID=A0A3P3YCX1_PLABS|nr:unnamed protein product [Plasmodiophora brassicae]